MKKTAVLLYDQFCNFEISVLLELLTMAEKKITVFAKSKAPVRSEEGIVVVPELSIEELNIDEYDSLVLPGAMDIRSAIEDDAIIQFIQSFDSGDTIIGAISIAPILLLKAGMLKDKPFMAGVNKEDLFEEGFTEQDLSFMKGWDDNLHNPEDKGYIISDNIITSVSYNFVRWALGFGEMLDIHISPKTFGME